MARPAAVVAHALTERRCHSTTQASLTDSALLIPSDRTILAQAILAQTIVVAMAPMLFEMVHGPNVAMLKKWGGASTSFLAAHIMASKLGVRAFEHADMPEADRTHMFATEESYSAIVSAQHAKSWQYRRPNTAV